MVEKGISLPILSAHNASQQSYKLIPSLPKTLGMKTLEKPSRKAVTEPYIHLKRCVISLLFVIALLSLLFFPLTFSFMFCPFLSSYKCESQAV